MLEIDLDIAHTSFPHELLGAIACAIPRSLDSRNIE